MIRIEGTRFGTIEVPDETLIEFANGLVGFPNETAFVLLERGEGRQVGYLQSVNTPKIAFPVTDGSVFPNYPLPDARKLARNSGLDDQDVVVLVIVAANVKTKALEANQLAPLIVDATSRRGVQCVLDSRKFSACASLADPVAVAKARIDAIRRKKPKATPEEKTASEPNERPRPEEELSLAANL